MNKQLLFLLAFLMLGCKNFETKKLTVEQITQDELEQVDWKNLDTYPSFDACNKYASKIAKKDCFENEISSYIFKALKNENVELEDSINVKMELTINISEKGQPALDSISIPRKAKSRIPKLQNIIEEAITSLPKIYPAEKRGIPVKSSFKLPLVIQTK